MRISAEFDQYEDAVEAHRALVDDLQVDPGAIEIRSPYPLPEAAVPRSTRHPMRMRNGVRLLSLGGALAGLAMAAGSQWHYPIPTGGHSIILLPTNAIIAFECGMAAGLVGTAVLFLVETRGSRARPIPPAEDLAVGSGDCTLVVEGPMASHARERLQAARGVRCVRTLSSLLAVATLLLLGLGLAGCTVRMRNQPAIRDSEQPTVAAAEGTSSMPWWKDPDVEGLPLPYGRVLTPAQLAAMRARYPVKAAQGGRNTPPEVGRFPNPVRDGAPAMELGKRLYAENCTFCHGTSGRGDGRMAEVYQPKPANLSRQDLVNQADGALYWTISLAPAGMPPFATRLSGMERFTLVRYLRSLQREAGQEPSLQPPSPSPPPGKREPAPSHEDAARDQPHPGR